MTALNSQLLSDSIVRLGKAKARGRWMRRLTFGLWSNSRRIKIIQDDVEEFRAREVAWQEVEQERIGVNRLNSKIRVGSSESGLVTYDADGDHTKRIVGSATTIIGGASYPDDWEMLAQIVRRRDGGCTMEDGYCDGPLHVHHIVPLSQGGTDELTNLTTLCLVHHSLQHPQMRSEN